MPIDKRRRPNARTASEGRTAARASTEPQRIASGPNAATMSGAAASSAPLSAESNTVMECYRGRSSFDRSAVAGQRLLPLK